MPVFILPSLISCCTFRTAPGLGAVDLNLAYYNTCTWKQSYLLSLPQVKAESSNYYLGSAEPIQLFASESD